MKNLHYLISVWAYRNATLVKTLWCWHKDRKDRSLGQNAKSRNGIELISSKKQKQFNVERKVCSTHSAKKIAMKFFLEDYFHYLWIAKDFLEPRTMKEKSIKWNSSKLKV